MMVSADELKKTQEIATIVKRNLLRIEKLATKFFYHAFKMIRNTDGDLTQKRRDEFAEGLCEFISSDWKEIFNPITNKIDYTVKDLEVDLYKQNSNWTDIFAVIKFTLAKKIEIHTGIVFDLEVKDIFVLLMSRSDLAEIVSDSKRPKRFYHYKTIKN